jgi:hypothetical protein
MGYSSDFKHFFSDTLRSASAKESFSDGKGKIKGCGWAPARHQVTWNRLCLVRANASENKYVTSVGTVQIVTYHTNRQMLRTLHPNVGLPHGWLSKMTTLHPLMLSFKYLINRKLSFPSWGFQVSETGIWENLANFKYWGLKNQASIMPFQMIIFFKYTLVIWLVEVLMSCCKLWFFFYLIQ